MGSSTYRWLIENTKGPWPYKVPCFVFTHKNFNVIEGADVRFVKGEVLPHYQELKTQLKEKIFGSWAEEISSGSFTIRVCWMKCIFRLWLFS